MSNIENQKWLERQVDVVVEDVLGDINNRWDDVRSAGLHRLMTKQAFIAAVIRGAFFGTDGWDLAVANEIKEKGLLKKNKAVLKAFEKGIK